MEEVPGPGSILILFQAACVIYIYMHSLNLLKTKQLLYDYLLFVPGIFYTLPLSVYI